jgi:hypothetical protein
MLTTVRTIYLNWKLELGLTAGVTGRQGMLTPTGHLIPPLVFPGVRVSLVFIVDCSICLNFLLDADFFVYLTWRIDFDCGLY